MPEGRMATLRAQSTLVGEGRRRGCLKLKDWRDGKTWSDDEKAAIMPAVVKGLNDADVAALATYVEGLHAAEAGSTAAK
jgi:cytochrome c553